MEPASNGEEPTSWEELYNINLMPSELFFKFRKEIEGLRVGVNLEVSFFVSSLLLFYIANMYMYFTGELKHNIIEVFVVPVIL